MFSIFCCTGDIRCYHVAAIIHQVVATSSLMCSRVLPYIPEWINAPLQQKIYYIYFKHINISLIQIHNYNCTITYESG